MDKKKGKRILMQIKSYVFNKEFKEQFEEKKFKDYPLVYILNNEKKAYVGETTNVISRMNAHIKDKRRKGIKNINLILSEEFNQSATYNIETNLINYFIAEGKYELQNVSQTKQKVMHNYKDKNYYDKIMFEKIWNELRAEEIVTQTIEQIENKDVFKISPYKSLSSEQAELKVDILDFCKTNIQNGTKGVYVVQGEAGTGKSVLISSLYNTIQDMSKLSTSDLSQTENYLLVNHGEMLKTYHTLAKQLPNLKKKYIEKPTTFLNKVDSADITIIDEAHLLLSSRDSFNGFNGDNHLKDIIDKSNVTILIYDPKQYLKVGSYWDTKSLDKILGTNKVNQKSKLVNQLRMNAGEVSIDWMNNFVNKKVLPIPYDENYIIKPFNSAKDMHEEIIKKNKEVGLSRIVSTFDFLHKKDGADYYVETSDFKLPWNREYKNRSWAEIESTINEVGSIYTIQGFDLNYVGVILGPSVKYDEVKNEIYIDIKEYKDTKAFSVPSTFDKSIDVNKVKEQIVLNSINVLMKRGIKGTFIYAYDDQLRKKLMS